MPLPLRKLLASLLLVALGIAQPARATIAPLAEDSTGRAAPAADYLEARQYKITDAQVAGASSLPAHQTMTAWQVTRGSWQGQALDGLSLVLVQTTPDDSQGTILTSCYVSYLATPAQRLALVNAFQASLGLPLSSPGTSTAWRIEPAVIRLEILGHRVILHLGVIA